MYERNSNNNKKMIYNRLDINNMDVQFFIGIERQERFGRSIGNGMAG